MKRRDYYFLNAAAVATLLLSACAEDVNTSNGVWNQGKNKGIGFDVDVSQDWTGESPKTRAVLQRNRPRNIQMNGNGGTAWLQETTLTGINERHPVQAKRADDINAVTRGAKVESVDDLGGFSTFSYKSEGELYYSNVQASKEGVLSESKEWENGQSLRFYAVHPADATTANFTPAFGGVAYNFAVNTSDVTAQTDLMYAATGDLAYNADGIAPIHFKHALTAVSFAFGSDVEFDKTISSITLKNVYTTGTYTLPANDEGTGTWSNLGNKTDVTLSGLSVAAVAASANTAITGASQNFLMIPQDLNGVQIEIGFSDATTETATLTEGAWEQGTTKVYRLSKSAESWTYQLTVEADDYGELSKGFYDEKPLRSGDIQTGPYAIASYRYNADESKQEEVAWTITKYEYSDDDGVTWVDNGTTKPAWLERLSLGESGVGGMDTYNYGYAYVTLDSIDLKEALDNRLKAATAKTDYDLSTKGGTVARSTANSYLISSPGTYKIPLVYGNAIKNGATNNVCFNKQPFVDYQGNLLTQANIKNVTASTTAALVWKDVTTDIVSNLAVDVANNFLTFTVPQEAIEQGNAVIGIKNGNDYVWSWHLWFTENDALETTSITNASSQVQHFTRDNLGQTYDYWSRSKYDMTRRLRMTITQTEGEQKSATLEIRQLPGFYCVRHETQYQIGRKDAFSGLPIGFTSYMGSMTSPTGFVNSAVSYSTAIKNPNTIYYDNSIHSWCSTENYNAWSSDLSGTDTEVATSNVVKTVYDPCPAGYKLPGSNAWTGFFESNCTSAVTSTYTLSGAGWHFTIGGNTVFFPATRYYTVDNSNTYLRIASYVTGQSISYYWTVLNPRYAENTRSVLEVMYSESQWNPSNFWIGSYNLAAFPVRPVRE